jgi:hypothetical protein
VKQQTSLAGKPTALFLFGDRNDPRLLPVATIGHGRVTPITLDADGWRKFDGLYFKAGSQVAVYRRGSSLGNAVVSRGMWDGDAPLYKLPGCHALRPLAAATLAAPADALTLELLGTSDPLPPGPPHPDVPPAMADSARELTARVAGREGLTATDRADLELTVSAFNTGASSQPTLVGAYSERGGGSGANARHVFMLADANSAGVYDATYVHTAKDSVPEFRRLIDHADLTGDGVDEIVLEGWRTGGDTYLVIMKFDAGRWHEVARGGTSWCADAPKGQ